MYRNGGVHFGLEVVSLPQGPRYILLGYMHPGRWLLLLGLGFREIYLQ